MKVLIVDDVKANRKGIQASLEAEGHHILEAADGLEALAVLKRDHVDAIISDILMPNMDGYGLCYEVRKSPQFRTIPFIMCTSTYTSAADHEFATKKLGADRFFIKPVPAQTIVEALRELTTTARGTVMQEFQLSAEAGEMKAYSQQLIIKLEQRNDDLVKLASELKKAHDELEERVEQRTKDLAQANLKLREANDRLNALSRTDSLTGIFNRGACLELAQAEWERWRRYRTPFSVLLLDVDHFKSINDSHGHLSGDRVLRWLADMMRQSLRVVDICGRYGGEEFMAILPDTRLWGAVVAGGHVLQSIRKGRMDLGGGVINVTVSIGVASANSSDFQLESILHHADQALYSAKHQGRDRLVYAPINGASELLAMPAENVAESFAHAQA